MQTKIFNHYFEREDKLHSEKIQLWMDHSLFTWQWWLGVVLLFLPIILWLLFRKRGSTDRLLYAGFFVSIISSFLDSIGDFSHLWEYNYEVFPFTTYYLPWSLSALPVSVMFVLQIRPKFNPFLKGIIFSAVCSFVILPIFKVMGIYDPVKWKYIYSFPITLIIFLIAYYLSKRKEFNQY
jgi:hypothetical protein